jgi:hypothetical protein
LRCRAFTGDIKKPLQSCEGRGPERPAQKSLPPVTNKEHVCFDLHSMCPLFNAAQSFPCIV